MKYNINEDKSTSRVCFVVLYFGKLPQDILLFLRTAAYNFGFSWLIFTDDKTNIQESSNVKIIKCSFGEITRRIQDSLDFNIKINSPKKLCDFKPTYGYIFQEELKEYDFWGYCDLD